MGIFRSSNKQRAAKEEDTWQTRPSPFPAPVNSLDSYQNENSPQIDRVVRSQISTQGYASVRPVAYQDRSNYTPNPSNGNHNAQDLRRDGVINAHCVDDEIGRDGCGSIDTGHKHFDSALWSWIPHVTQSADDTTVIDRVKAIFASAEQFVNDFYTDRIYEHEIPDGSLERVNCSSLYSEAQLRWYLSKADCHTSLIKHTLVSFLLNLISFDSTSSKGSLLPTEFQNYNVIARARTMSTYDESDLSGLQPALSSFRVLSAYIWSHVQNDGHYLQERQKVVDEVIRHFECVFRFWTVEERTLEDRNAALRQVLQKAGALGIFLFSQPSVFFFSWDMTQQDQADHLVPLWPRMLKVYDEEAQRRAVSDHLLPMKYGVIFRRVPKEQMLAQIPDNTTTRLLDLSPLSNGNEVQTGPYSNDTPVPDMNRYITTHNTRQATAGYNRESISPLNSDDEGSNRSWVSNDAQNTPHQISSSTRLQQVPSINPAAQYSQSSIKSATAAHPSVVIPGVQDTPESFRTNGTGDQLRTLPLSSQSLPQRPRMTGQSARASAEDYNRNTNSQNRNDRPNQVHNPSDEPWQRPQTQQSRRPLNQHSRTASNTYLDGEQPPPYSSPVTYHHQGFSSRRNASPHNPRNPNRIITTTFNHSTHASEPSLSSINQFSRTGQDRMYFPPPPNTQKPQRDSSSSLPRFMQRRSSSSRDESTTHPDSLPLQQQQQQQQHRPRERRRERGRDRNFYPPNATPWLDTRGAVQTAGDQSGLGHSQIERAGRSIQRSEGGREKNGSRSRKRSSSVASSVRSFFLGDR